MFFVRASIMHRFLTKAIHSFFTFVTWCYSSIFIGQALRFEKVRLVYTSQSPLVSNLSIQLH